MLEAGLIASRFLHYTATLILFGISIFPHYTYQGSTGSTMVQAHHLLQTIMRWAAFAALFSAVFWFMGVVSNMMGTLAGALDWEAAWSVLSETSFGSVWIVRFILAVIILALTTAGLKSLPKHLSWHLPVLCGVLLVSLAGVGHTHVDSGIGRVIHMSADGLHLLAAGAWLGGLVSLFYLVARGARKSSPVGNAEVSRAALHFSGMGYIAVATLIGSGLINSWFLVGWFSNLATPYGRLLIVKLILFACMLALAALNRFFLVPRMTKASASDKHTVADQIKLRRHILAEQALGILVILIVSALGTMEPAIKLSQG